LAELEKELSMKIASTASLPPLSGSVASSVVEEVRTYKYWYHNIDLPGGISTGGPFDLRQFATKAMPPSLAGLRCLDVGTFDGFWAFQMEDRGAQEVIALDLENLGQLDWPPNEIEANRAQIERGNGAVLGTGFRIASKARDSKVRRIERSVFDLRPEEDLGGHVDFALVGTILQHVRDPVGALVRVRDAVKPGGRILVIDTISTMLTLAHPNKPLASFRPTTPGSQWTWWVPNLEALKRYARTAGLIPSGSRFPPTCRMGSRRGDRLAAILCERP
jgi:tRNA (mo5U34)-methyltransferase